MFPFIGPPYIRHTYAESSTSVIRTRGVSAAARALTKVRGKYRLVKIRVLVITSGDLNSKRLYVKTATLTPIQ
jgi:hypothetical protein